MASPTSYTTEQGRKIMDDWKFSAKKDYGPKEFGAKISWIRHKGQKIEMQFGVSPLDDPDSLDLLTTEWGITVFISKAEREKQKKEKEQEQEQEQRQPPPGVPGFQPSQFQNWSGAPPPGAPPQQSTFAPYPTGQNQDENVSTKTEVKKNDRRSFDIVVQYGSETKKFCDEADQRVKQEALNHPQEWFNREKIGEEAVDLLYSSSVKKPSDDQLPALSTKTNVNELVVYSCDIARKYTESSFEKVRKDVMFLVTIEISGVWFIKSKEQPVKNFGLAWNTKSILLFSTTARPKFNFQLGNTYTASIESAAAAADPDKEEEDPAEKEDNNLKRSFPFNASSQSAPPSTRPKIEASVVPGSNVSADSAPNPAYEKSSFPPV